MSSYQLNRREFVALAATGIAGGALRRGTPSPANSGIGEWDPDKPLIITGKALRVQPVLMYRVAERKQASSWKSWGGVQSDDAAAEEAERISNELAPLSAGAGFAFEALPVIKVKSTEEAARVHDGDYDVVVIYAASGSGELLKACFPKQKDKDAVIFVRHSRGPAYYWYEALSTKYLKTRDDSSEQNSWRDHGGLYVDDVVVDDYEQLVWRLRALYGIKNFVGARIVALGGPWGKYSPEAPQAAREKYRIEIVEVSYDEASRRIEAARKDADLPSKAQRWAERYLTLPNTTLMTDKKFVANAFLLYGVFRDLMSEHDAPAFTIRECMTRILPIAQTTPCLALSLLNDEGLMAFCESDFVVIPAGILLHYISGRPVFLHNSTFPHDGIVTCAHCSAPRRMDAKRYEPAKIMTHYESEYGAAPKVEIPQGQDVTFIDPEYSTGRWVGFKGVVRDNPLLEICRSQQDVEIVGDWRKLLNEVRDSHWMMAYGDYLKEVGYASRKIGIRWEDIT